MKEESEISREIIENSEVQVVFFDERKDQTKMLVEDEDREQFSRTLPESHYTLTDPYNYLTHLTPEEGTGAQGTADVILEWLKDVGQLENVKVLGGVTTNSMTGWEGGAIHYIEVGKMEKVVWDICLLHTNELGLRHVMKSKGLETSGKICYSGEIGGLFKGDVHL